MRRGEASRACLWPKRKPLQLRELVGKRTGLRCHAADLVKAGIQAVHVLGMRRRLQTKAGMCNECVCVCVRETEIWCAREMVWTAQRNTNTNRAAAHLGLQGYQGGVEGKREIKVIGSVVARANKRELEVVHLVGNGEGGGGRQW